MTTGKQVFELSISSKGRIVVESKYSKDKASKFMCRWIYGYFLEKGAIISYRAADTTIKDVLSESLGDAIDNLEKRLIVRNLIRAY
jgi:hypothetical protein